jgi:hypothetical protein
MSRKSKTVVTFAVRLELPPGSNCHSIQAEIRQALIDCGVAKDETFTVALTKKETTYGTK